MPPRNPDMEPQRRRAPEEREDGHRARFPRDKRRHEEDVARQEMALADLHDRRRDETRDPRRQRAEAQAAERHAENAARHRGRVTELGEAELHEDRRRRMLSTPSKGSLIAYRVLLPIGLLAAAAIGLAGIIGLSSPGIVPLGTAIMGLTIGVAVNAVILFALLVSLRTNDARVRQLARVEAAHYAHQVRQEEEMRESRRGDLEQPGQKRPQVNMVEYHKVEVRPRKARTTSEDDQYQTRTRGH